MNDLHRETPRVNEVEFNRDCTCAFDPVLVVGSDFARQLERELAVEKERADRAEAQAEIYRQETHRWSEAHRAVEAGELKRLAERFNCAPEHAVTAALAFAITADGVLAALRAKLQEYEDVAKVAAEETLIV